LSIAFAFVKNQLQTSEMSNTGICYIVKVIVPTQRYELMKGRRGAVGCKSHS